MSVPYVCAICQCKIKNYAGHSVMRPQQIEKGISTFGLTREPFQNILTIKMLPYCHSSQETSSRLE